MIYRYLSIDFKTHFISEPAHDPHACSMNGSAVCSDIAYSYMLLLNTAGVACKYVSGKVKGFRRAWNIIQINGQWYHVEIF